MEIFHKPLKHFNSRKNAIIDAIILHYPAPNLLHDEPYSTEAVWKLLRQEKLSYHYYVSYSGQVTQFVQDTKRAWHAGVGTLHGRPDPNTWSIGVCMANNGGQPYTKEQMVATAHLCVNLADQYNIPWNRIVGHEHVSPGRKIDPGSHFDWNAFFTEMANIKAFGPRA